MKYPLGIQTFSKIIAGNMVYVDKTAILYDLIEQGSVYFLSRSRRFGKSLLISTLDAIFSGQKDLFDGLAIADTDYEFVVYPVIKLEFTKDEFQTADNLREYIATATNAMAEQYHIELNAISHNQRLLFGGKIARSAHALYFYHWGIEVCQNFGVRAKVNGQWLLVFPSLINEKRPLLQDISMVDGASYRISGATENLYASLVVQLGYTSTFTRNNQWQDQAEYEMNGETICGFKQYDDGEGEIELVLYYQQDSTQVQQQMFQSTVELFLTQLTQQQLTIARYQLAQCSRCGKTLKRNVVLDVLREGQLFSFCHGCGNKVTLANPDILSSSNLPNLDEVSDEKRHVRYRTAYETALALVATLYSKKAQVSPPRCFISYSWGVESHSHWVENFADDLRQAGIEVLLDLTHSLPGSNLDEYLDNILDVDFVLVVGTELLAQKYQDKSFDSVVSDELKMIHLRARQTARFGETVIPLLLEGNADKVLTPKLQGLVNVDFNDDKRYFRQLFDLVWLICGLAPDHPQLKTICAGLSADSGLTAGMR